MNLVTKTIRTRLAAKAHNVLLVASLSCLAVAAGAEPATTFVDTNDGAIRYQAESRTVPRPLALHWLVIDLADEDYELAVAVGADPDGAGPIEAQLTPPSQLAATADFVVAVNTNPWIMVPCPGTDEKAGYVAGGCCDISGWVREEARTHSPVDKSHWSFWIDAGRLAQLGPIAQDCPARCSVAGFGGLLDDGKVLPRPSDVRHPRTALGLDPSGRWLTLLVVDGRQPGYSEGVSLDELAQMMRGAGCWRALNLDGGGSSVMLAADGSHGYQILNRPSGRQGPRPIPVMLGIRRR